MPGRYLFETADDEVHVWTLDLDRPAFDNSILSPDEQARAVRLVKAEDRRRFAAAHVAVRQILGQYMDTAPDAVGFLIDRAGKPHLNVPNQAGLAFSLSHSAGCGLLAVTGGRAVGVDIEMMRTFDDLHGMAKQIMSDAEWAEFQPLLADPARSEVGLREVLHVVGPQRSNLEGDWNWIADGSPRARSWAYAGKNLRGMAGHRLEHSAARSRLVRQRGDRNCRKLAVPPHFRLRDQVIGKPS